MFSCFRPVPMLPYRPPKTQKDCWALDIVDLRPTDGDFLDLHYLLRLCATFWTVRSITEFPVKRGLMSHLGATPLKGALLSSLRYQWTIYLFNYLTAMLPVCAQKHSDQEWFSLHGKKKETWSNLEDFFCILWWFFYFFSQMKCWIIQCFYNQLSCLNKWSAKKVFFGLKWR